MPEPSPRSSPFVERLFILALLVLIAAGCLWMLTTTEDAARGSKRDVGLVYAIGPVIGLFVAAVLAIWALLTPRLGFAFVCVLSGLATVAGAVLCLVYLPLAFGTMLGSLLL